MLIYVYKDTYHKFLPTSPLELNGVSLITASVLNINLGEKLLTLVGRRGVTLEAAAPRLSFPIR